MYRAHEPGMFLAALLLDGEPTHSEGLYSLDRWAVRLGCDPHSDEAKMASLHESYHADLNDSTAFGSLLHVAGLVARERPDRPDHMALLTALLAMAVTTHETYATYASVFLVERGRPDGDLLAAYPGYERYLTDALALARTMPNPIVGFLLVQSITRAAMQTDCVSTLLHTPAERWAGVGIPLHERPDERLRALARLDLGLAARRDLLRWAESAAPEIREVLDARIDGDADYEEQIAERLDPAVDAIGAFLYEYCRQDLLAQGRSCLEYNGHQRFTAALRAHVDPLLPAALKGRDLVAAPEGSRHDDVVRRFADEQLVLDPQPPRAVWLWLDEVPEARWPELMVGATTPHALVVVRPRRRVDAQYDFGSRGLPPVDGPHLVALRRRAIVEDGRPTIEFVLVRNPAQLAALREALAARGDVLLSCSLSALVDPAWQDGWLPVVRTCVGATVLFDLDPFSRLRAWDEQADIVVDYATLTLHSPERNHQVFALRPRIADDLLFLVPCSAAVQGALVLELRRLGERSGRFVRNDEILTNGIDRLRLVVGHLLHEEPWFDFLAGADQVGGA